MAQQPTNQYGPIAANPSAPSSTYGALVSDSQRIFILFDF